MRDSIKNDAYFKNYIQTNDLLHERRQQKLSDNIIVPERIEIVKADMSKNKLAQSIAKYSAGFSENDILGDYYIAIDLAFEGWKKKRFLDSQRH